MTVKRLHSFENYAQVARSEADAATRPVIPPPTANAQQSTRSFLYQSYFDSTLLQNAILTQLANNPIVDPKEESIPGYSVGLHPASDTPVAIQFRVGGQIPSSGTLILAPGQYITPFGQVPGAPATPFSGFKWGLPYGWLGGGTATLLIFPSPVGNVAWNGSPEIIFHRMRLQIQNVAGAPSAAPLNWPTHFPWVNAAQGSNQVPQKGTPQISVTPTRALMSLRLNSLAAATQMLFLVQSSNDFDLDSSGAPILTNVRRIPYTWGTYAATGIAGNLGTAYPVVDVPDDVVRLAADGGGIQLVDASGGALLDNQYVDIVRYGRLG